MGRATQVFQAMEEAQAVLEAVPVVVVAAGVAIDQITYI